MFKIYLLYWEPIVVEFSTISNKISNKNYISMPSDLIAGRSKPEHKDNEICSQLCLWRFLFDGCYTMQSGVIEHVLWRDVLTPSWISKKEPNKITACGKQKRCLLQGSIFICLLFELEGDADGLAGQKTWRTTHTTMRRYKYAIYKKCSFLLIFLYFIYKTAFIALNTTSNVEFYWFYNFYFLYLIS
jgi:hypothetical protein